MGGGFTMKGKKKANKKGGKKGGKGKVRRAPALSRTPAHLLCSSHHAAHTRLAFLSPLLSQTSIAYKVIDSSGKGKGRRRSSAHTHARTHSPVPLHAL